MGGKVGFKKMIKKLLTKKQQRKWILKNWSSSSGKRIAEMCRRYWSTPEENIINIAKEVFNDK